MSKAGNDRKGCSLTLTLTVCAAAIGGTFQYGYNIAIINAPTTSIQKFINETCLERWGTALTSSKVTLTWTLIVSAFSLGGLLGSLLAGPMAIHCGRRQTLLLNNCFLMASAVMALSSRPAKSFEIIVVARVLIGVNAGVSMNVQPMYFGESAPKALRGAVAFSCAVFTAMGILLGQVVGLTEVLGDEALWPYLLASNAIPGLLQLLTLPWFPESPRYLLIDRGDREACGRALGRLRGREASDAEMEEILEEQKATGEARAKSPWELLADGDLRRQLCVVMAASSSMMLCGNDSIYFYASYIFQEAGIGVEKIQYATIGTGACEFAAAIMSNLLIERGKVAGMPYLSMACIFAYILSFGMGPAGVTGILPTELFDQKARPAAYMLAGSMMWVNLFLVGMAFPFIVNSLGQFCFVPFCGICVVSAIYIRLTLPETKGKTLAEITAEFDKCNMKGLSSSAQNQLQLQETQHRTDLTSVHLEIEEI
ncbi:solute carrier family 2, facilitated glucose transporter member 11 isoform X2 [Electrophorus electricus]|uniref:solute carrier family 2, facilitated glucose transporter member 11 isoform X2 n=1 Tax=Electrophorus electricus TaxID=8005 RepID=UPI0015D0849F|nr:solute carrier family 2, facilitated glucose transporter member 11 isoform X2 [Electrophorus electricus]